MKQDLLMFSTSEVGEKFVAGLLAFCWKKLMPSIFLLNWLSELDIMNCGSTNTPFAFCTYFASTSPSIHLKITQWGCVYLYCYVIGSTKKIFLHGFLSITDYIFFQQRIWCDYLRFPGLWWYKCSGWCEPV